MNALRGRVFLPHSCASSTKQSLLVVFASGAAANAARAAGADVVGAEELVEQIISGELAPDKLITTPELLSLFQRNPSLARTLGPKGLMPSAKRGTVATDIAQAVKEARGGLDWKGDSKGVVRAGEGYSPVFFVICSLISYTPTAIGRVRLSRIFATCSSDLI